MSIDTSARLLVENDEGLVFACALDGAGGAELQDWDSITTWTPDNKPLWVHLDRAHPNTTRWLTEKSGIEDHALTALLEEETRPRVFKTKTGLVAILRGVNLNAEDDPDDMVALRLHLTEHRLISVRLRPLMTPRDMLKDMLETESGARTIPDLFLRLTERLTERMNSVVVGLDETLDEIEGQLGEQPGSELRSRVSSVRHTAVGLRRYIGPQREALSEIQILRPDWLTPEHTIHLRESANRLQRYVEDLDAARDRAIVIRDELSNRQADAMNARMYALSVIAGIFLPLSFLTGLLGINVGGMPGVENASAFWITVALLVVLLGVEVYIFKRLKWI